MILKLTDPSRCRQLWEEMVPDTGLFGLWDVRECFHRHYDYESCFLVARRNGETRGFLALSEIIDHGYWGCFPGETYKGKTWLEQNPLITDSDDTTAELLDDCPHPLHLRYLEGRGLTNVPGASIDEVGYLFRPADYGFRFERYLSVFSGKSRKKLGRELDVFTNRGVVFRHNDPADAERAFLLNLEAFGDGSYFADRRFLASFRSLLAFLHRHGLLRVTAVLVGDRLAAVDVGAVYRGIYTVLAGGTDPEFPGIAKLINFHHIEWACLHRLKEVDFLCGDFGWKERFHLTARPLYQITAPCALLSTIPEGEVAIDAV
jgi:hypothetical protein